MIIQFKSSQQRKRLLTPVLIVIFLWGVSSTGKSMVYAETTSDFVSDVQRGLRIINQNDPLNSLVTAIRIQDYKTSWDEFGTNILVDGANTSADVQKSLTEDIVKDLQMQLTYNQKDEQYLRLRHSSPEEVLMLEGDGGNDLLPENYVEPHPSLDANPGVNPSALDMQADVFDLSDTFIPSDTKTFEDPLILPDNLVPSEGQWKPADITVFETIINAGTPSTDVPSEPSPDASSDSSPSNDVQPPEAPVN